MTPALQRIYQRRAIRLHKRYKSIRLMHMKRLFESDATRHQVEALDGLRCNDWATDDPVVPVSLWGILRRILRLEVMPKGR